MNKDHLYLFRLTTKPNLSYKKIFQLIQYYGSLEEASAATPPKENWEKEWEALEKMGISLVAYTDSHYPKNFLTLPDFPLLLYVRGNFDWKRETGIGMIGTRNATLYGKEMAERFGQELAEREATVISGLARGIDTAAHRGALRSGRTVAVIGSGLAHLYPRENTQLAEEIAEKGALISEYPPHTPPAKHQFPLRNRLVSALSEALLLVESPLKGGGMITMCKGEEHGKKLFALPGRLDWPTFEGNHFLIREKKADLVCSSQEIAERVGLHKKIEKKENSACLTEEERAFLKLIPSEEKTIDELVLLTQFPVMKLNILLTRLVLKKVMKELPGKIYKKIYL